MSITNSITTVAVLFAIVAATAGCGKSKTQAQGESNMGSTSTQTELFPEPQFTPIEFTPTKRDAPQTAEEAIASLEAIKKLYNWSNIPAALNKDVSMESTHQYVKAWKLLRSQMPQDIAWLKSLDGKSVPGVDRISTQKIDNSAKSQIEWLENRLPKQMDDSAKYTRQFLEGCVAPMTWNHIEKAADCDMSNSSQVTNLLSRQDVNRLRAKQIEKVAVAYESLIFFDDVMGVESDWAAKKKTFRDMVVRYQEKLEQAADAIQPPADIGNAELKAIAAEVLANKQYKLTKAERIIVNAPKKSFGKDHFTIDFGERTIEKSPYRWEEFQVATIEKDGDQYFLWYNTIMYYSVGPHTVPTEKWVLGPRHKSAPISKKNINN